MKKHRRRYDFFIHDIEEDILESLPKLRKVQVEDPVSKELERKKEKPCFWSPIF